MVNFTLFTFTADADTEYKAMSTALDISEPSSPQSCLGEPDTPGALNRACLRDDSSLLVEDSDGDCKDLSSVTVPETPRYILR